MIDFNETMPFFYLALAVTALSLWLMYRIEHSRGGNIWKAIALEDDLAKSVGINVRRYKMSAFVTGSCFAGIAGVFLAHYIGSIDPWGFATVVSMQMIVAVIFGGYIGFMGPILGGISMAILREVLRPVVEWYPFALGLIMIITLLFIPRGLERPVSRLINRVKQKRSQP